MFLMFFQADGMRFMSQNNEKQRVIQEYVPGKQVTLAHIIANPNADIYKKLGLGSDTKDAIGILTITPSEASIIAADIATKAAGVLIGFVDRFSGSVVITGDVSSVESALNEVLLGLQNILGFSATKITRT
ncbi:propanediol utilization protein PduU [Brevibacillus laterosporus PE36]|nr:propanediol utilization protein PduU [Brevibacillus laterosporus PE36]